MELSEDRLREALVARCRAEHIEPPAPSRIERVVGTARAAFDQRFTTEIASRLSASVTAGLETFVAETDEAGFLAELKADPAKPGIETLLVEIDKLARVKALGLPAELFGGFSEKLVDAWRSRAARLYPSDLRASPAPVRLTLLAALCWHGRPRSSTAWSTCLSSWSTRSTPPPSARSGASCSTTSGGYGARRGSSSPWPRPPSTTPTTPSGPPCTRW